MRKSMLVLIVFAGLGSLALPAAAESGEGTCGAPISAAPAGPIDLSAIPMQEPTARKAIQGVGDVGCDDDRVVGAAGSGGEDESGSLDDD